MSISPAAIERFLEGHAFERANWLTVGFAAGIAAWFALDTSWQWLALLGACLGLVAAGVGLAARAKGWPFAGQALAAMALMLAAGCGLVWAKSSLMGVPAISRPQVLNLVAEIESREERPAEQRVRLVLRTRLSATDAPAKVRINLPLEWDSPALTAGARLRLRARLTPPAPPMLPGGYDFARTAWFTGLAATGSALAPPELIAPAEPGLSLEGVQQALSRHVRASLAGSEGAIAAAFASGDRGGIDTADETAMRDAGLTHLLSISGLHVSAVVGATYFLAIRLLALWPWLALRVRLPLLAAAGGALAGIAYTLLTGAEVPTVRSCIGALLVLAAVALGREPLSLRMVATAAFVVLLFWPEAVVSPGFQMSFGSVIAIVALVESAPMRTFAARRESDGLILRLLRLVAVLLLTGIVIELALMPIGLFHFHRAGVYGALANVVAIPLTTFIIMPLIALALLADVIGLGAPVWWLAGQALSLLLGLARGVAAQPGAVTQLPAMGHAAFALFVAGALWLALWKGRVRLWGLAPIAVAAVSLVGLRAPDVLISNDGRHVGITGEGPELLVLRGKQGGYAADTLSELAGMDGTVRRLADWPGARCNRDFCAIVLERGGRSHTLLISRGRDRVNERDLAAACELSDLVISDRWLPSSCRPRWLLVDRDVLGEQGGLAIDLVNRRVRSVAEQQGEHGWFRRIVREPYVAPGAGPRLAPGITTGS